VANVVQVGRYRLSRVETADGGRLPIVSARLARRCWAFLMLAGQRPGRAVGSGVKHRGWRTSRGTR
jgi:hypothetical protein